VVAGDVDLAETDALVERYFGSFPASARPARRVPTLPPVHGPVRGEVHDKFAALVRIHRAWHGPRAFCADEPELDVLAGAWCAVGTGGLWRRLVYETELAQRVSAWTLDGRIGGELHVAIDLRTGADLAAVRAILDDECARRIDEAAIARQVTRREASAIWSLASLSRRANLLQRYALYTEDPDGLAADLARYRAVTPDRIAAAMQRWLSPERMVEIVTVPTARGGSSDVRGVTRPASAGGRS
jgi:zinc protease